MKTRFIFFSVLVLFFLSGVCGLIYQVTWVRMFGLVFGNTLHASSVVLSTFMAGLAAGSFLAVKYIASRKDTLCMYSYIEVLVGACGLLIPYVMNMMSNSYTWIYQTFHLSFGMMTTIRLLFSFLILFIPCVLMGATLPILCAYLSKRHSYREAIPGKMYGINTLGAVAGCFITGFFLIKTVGVQQSGFIAAVINWAIALLAYMIYKKDKALKPDKTTPTPNTNPKSVPDKDKTFAVNIIMLCCTISGFAALILEVVWSKALARTIQMVWANYMDSYAFAAMLSVLLAGIGIGSYLISLFQKRVTYLSRVLYIVQFLLCVSIFISIFIIQNPISIKNGVYSFVNASALSGLMSLFISLLGSQALMQLLLAVVILFVPSLLMGISFPLFVILFFRFNNNIGKSVGIIYSVNTLGGVFGSLLAGFLFIPFIGLLPTTGFAASLYFITSLAVLLITEEKRVVKRVAFAVIVSTVTVLLFTTEFNYYHFLKSTLKPYSSGMSEKIVYYKENADGAILVKENRKSGKEMYNDGVIVAASKGQNLFSHIFPAHLISLLSKKPAQVLVIGSGCAVSSGSLLLYDDVIKLYAVEISKGIIEPAKKYFSHANNDAFSHDKFNLIIQDGKNYVKLTNKRFDVIYASPSLPQSCQGSAGLFTREFFADCKNKLTNDGLQCLWIPLHMYQPKEFLTIVKTFQEVYPHVSLWHPSQTEVTVGLAYLIGSKKPLLPDYQRIAEKLNKPEIIQDINRLGDGAFRTPEEFISFLSIGTKGLKNLTANISKVNTDNHPIIEFYDRAGDLIQSALMGKIKLIEVIGKNSENPYTYIQNIPLEINDTLKSRLALLNEGKQYLMMGHAASTYKVVYSAKGNYPKNLDIYINQYYTHAYKLMPENLFLRRYFGIK